MNIKEMISAGLSFLPPMDLSGFMEIFILAYLIYEILLWIKNTRAWLLLRGISLILIFTLLAALFRFDAILWILGRVATIAVTALIIIFQPELRSALEQLGERNLLFNFFKREVEDASDKSIEAIVSASFEMSKVKTGALMVMQRRESLSEYEKNGIALDAILTSQLLINIFEHNTPLHDGAIIIKGNRISHATCYLPLTKSASVSKSLGTRHRAAIGLSEVSDALIVVVSEETGNISVAHNRKLERFSDELQLRQRLIEIMTMEEKEEKRNFRFFK